MTVNGGSGAGHFEYRVLFVGSREWYGQIECVTSQLEDASNETVRTAKRARQKISSDKSIDCVVSAGQLDGTTGRELATDPAVHDASVPFILAPQADEATSLTELETERVSWIVPLADDGAGTTGVEGLAAVLSREREYGRHRRQGAQFQAAFDDPDRFAAVLAEDGTVLSLNDAGAEVLDAPADVFVGKRLWALPWRDGKTVRRDVQRAVSKAADGTYTEFEGVLTTRNSGSETESEVKLEFRIQPTAGDSPSRLLVQGTVLTEREQLEAEFRASEELHRVTLNNMTDTVLVTNDEGEFTYVCPNVHFIFGYTAEEIHEFGTIDELLGDELLDRDRLSSKGVLTNIECTATDKRGDEHTLLVNVRNVSIQGGTRLYSCRDITKRKQREQALTQLQQTSRDLLYAETEAEVAKQIAADATTALTSGGVALYQFDGRENVLYPMATSGPLWETLGSLPDVSLDQQTCISRAFVAEEKTTRTDILESEHPNLLFANLDDFAAIPLGEHGVLLTATVDGTVVNGVNEEVAELLAATAEAAFDRLERESELRERDKTLQQQNSRLSELNQVNEMIREIDQGLVHAETREEIEEAVCERLSAADRFEFAWIGEVTAHNRRLQPREWAGTDEGYLDTVSFSTVDEQTIAEPAVRTVRDRSMTVVPNVADQLREAAWCTEAVSRNFNSVLSIPLVFEDVLFGTLTVYDDEPNSFSETVRAVFSELGDTIGAAINAVQRKEALRSDSVFRLAYQIQDSTSVLLRLAAAFDCSLEVKSEVTRTDDTTLVFVAVEDASAEAVVSKATTFVDVADGEVIQETDGDSLVSLAVRDPFVTSLLTNHGATRRTLAVTPSDIRLVVDVPDSSTIRAVDEMLSNRFSDVELRSQQKQTRPAETRNTEPLLTDRQEEVGQVAYHSGFFDADRSVTGRDVAATLGVSHTTFYDHIRRIEQKLFAALFEHRQQYITVE